MSTDVLDEATELLLPVVVAVVVAEVVVLVVGVVVLEGVTVTEEMWSL